MRTSDCRRTCVICAGVGECRWTGLGGAHRPRSNQPGEQALQLKESNKGETHGQPADQHHKLLLQTRCAEKAASGLAAAANHAQMKSTFSRL